MKHIDLSAATARRMLAGVAELDVLDDEAAVDRWARVVWSHLVEPGDGAAGGLIESLGPAGALRAVTGSAPRAEIGGIPPREIADAQRRWLPRLAIDPVRLSLETARLRGIRLLTPEDRGWPGQLADLGSHAPVCLWVRGDVDVLARLRPSLALVGARAASSYGEHVALDLSADLAGSGIPVISGAAYGIDGAAHRAALAVGGTTVALLAGGVDRPYPAGHAQLLDRICAAGAVVSEVPCGSAPTKWRFLQRNRVISALASGVVVVEAGWRSGSLNTAGHALTLGRPLGAVPGPITSGASAGCHRLLREFGATCITGGADVRELLGLGAPPLPDDTLFELDAADRAPRTDHRTRVTDALSTRAWRAPTDLAQRSGMAVAEIEAILGLLALEGIVESAPQGWRRMPAAR